MRVNNLTWADDLVLLSQSAHGLQMAMDKTAAYYKSQGLSINHKKTKIIIFNKRGLKLQNENIFIMDNTQIEITDQYQYLGIKLKPSGSMDLATSELNAKANRA